MRISDWSSDVFSSALNVDQNADADAIVSQSGAYNGSNVTQNANGASASFTQAGDPASGGPGTGQGDNLSNITQNGASSATVNQLANNPTDGFASNDSLILQNGDGSSAGVTQTGDNNDSDVVQGARNSAVVNQDGDDNASIVSQAADNIADVNQQGNLNSSDIQQSGDFLRASVDQIGDENESTITQTRRGGNRSEEHTSELQSLMRISYAV